MLKYRLRALPVVPELARTTVSMENQGHIKICSRVAKSTSSILVCFRRQTSPAPFLASDPAITQERLVWAAVSASIMTDNHAAGSVLPQKTGRHEVCVFVIHKDDLGLAMIENVFNLSRRQAGIERCNHGSRGQDTVIGVCMNLR
jgi:hypothetical protein